MDGDGTQENGDFDEKRSQSVNSSTLKIRSVWDGLWGSVKNDADNDFISCSGEKK